ncbi:hypothetical protein S7711_11461 [Stachybotrys chartarum IBT 7711]|uniref:BZIP domain-containing protein n=1 Tax=Stachybotrys chartarum (strain CBS 109288 / IBT 7711) TaxID=1280523 RepID=A0A084B2V8_STACB|nr:hypothetical protein S7711_11461 [Stachybotrys chartarum IBT 7711]
MSQHQYIEAPASPPYKQHSGQKTCSALSTSAKPDENWTKISDLAERRRIQNRIAQRNYRKKLKRRLEDLESCATSSDKPERHARSTDKGKDKVNSIASSTRSNADAPRTNTRPKSKNKKRALPTKKETTQQTHPAKPMPAQGQSTAPHEFGFSAPYSSNFAYTTMATADTCLACLGTQVPLPMPSTEYFSHPVEWNPYSNNEASSPYMNYSFHPSINAPELL